MDPAGPARVERRLAAILAADVAGYSRLIEADEEGTLSRLKALRAELIDPKITEHHGRIVKTTGDGMLVEFASVVDALRCAAELQTALAETNTPLPRDRRIEFRIGINVGDIVVENGDIFGDGVNVAARLEGLAEPGGICVSARVRPTDDLSAYDLYLRAYAMVFSSTRQVPEALRLLEQAIARDPRYGPALAWAAQCCLRLLLDGRSEDMETDRLKGADFARRALEVGGDDPGILANAAHALAHFGEDIGAMIALVDRALVLNPNYARGWYVSSALRLWAGQPDIAIEHGETSLRLSPRARIGPVLSG